MNDGNAMIWTRPEHAGQEEFHRITVHSAEELARAVREATTEHVADCQCCEPTGKWWRPDGRVVQATATASWVCE
jgi:hypothetical protein